jgi:class I lanthipeptide synthase
MTTVREEAADVTRSIAMRLRTPALLRDGSSLWFGHPGIALLHATLSVEDGSWCDATHRHLTAASQAPEAQTADSVVGLLPPALVHHAAHGGYTRLLRRAGAVLAQLCRARIAARARRAGPGLAIPDYDVISGLAGKGRLLLALAENGSEDCADALHATLRGLVAITEPVVVRGVEVPGWWCRPQAYLVEQDRECYPDGDFNAGLAHGIAGPLALLAIAYRKGYRVDGMVAAMRRIADWLVRWRVVDGHGPIWPGRVSFAEQTRNRNTASAGRTRAAWCYGTAGVARALQLSGQALDDRDLSSLAITALRGIFTRPWRQANLDGPTLCHGEAGLLQVLNRAAELDPASRVLASRLARRLVRFELGAEHGLLQGAAGVALALATFAEASAEWDSVLLLC